MTPPDPRRPKSSASRLAARPAVPRSRAKLWAVLCMAAGILLGGVLIGVTLRGGSRRKAPPPAVAASPKAEAPEPRKDPDPVPERVPDPVPVPNPIPPPDNRPQEEFRARLAEKRRMAQERAGEARREAAAERKAEDEAAAALRARLQKKPVTLALKSGPPLKDALIRSYTMLNADVEAGGRPLQIAWDSVDAASLRRAADALFAPGVAREQFDRGRFFIGRRMWREALDSFERAAKLGEGYESRVLEFRDVLARLASGKGGFRGVSRRPAAERLLLAYDWREAAQLEDWSAGLALSGASAVLESKTRAEVALLGGHEEGAAETPVVFVGDLSAEIRLSSTVPVTFALCLGPRGGYELELGPAGAALFRVEPDAPEDRRRRPVAKTDQAKIVPGRTHEVRLRARQWKFTVSVDRQEAATLEDPPLSAKHPIPVGIFGISVEGGRLTLEAPLLLQGQVSGEELDTRLGETEVFIRRALDPDLDVIRERRLHRQAMQMLGEEKSLSLGSDDPYYIMRITNTGDLVEGYEKLKKELAAYLDGSLGRDFSLSDWEGKMGNLVRKYPDVPSLYYLRALCRDDRQDRALAREDVRKALELFPEFPEALILQAEHLLQEHDLEAALSAVNRALDARPDSVRALVLRARATCVRSPGAQESYLEDLAVARKIDPGDPDAAHFLRILRRQLRGPGDLGCRFDHETPHYRVTTDISAEGSRRYGEALEAAWRHYAETFRDVSRATDRRKPRVAVFQTAENYYTYFELLSESRGEHTLGVFRQELNELVLFETLDRTETLQTLYHEAFHHFMSLLMPETPPYWYNEGMAEYMAGITVENGRVTRTGQVLRGRGLVAQLMVEVGHTFSFERIMCESPREFYGPESDLKYAQAWSMIHFLYESGGGMHRPLIQSYFNEIRARKTPRQAYDSIFRGKADALEKDWKHHVTRIRP